MLTCLMILGCGSEEPAPSTDPDSGVFHPLEIKAEAGVPLPDRGQVAPEVTPSPVCDHYLSCLSAASPSAFPAALMVYRSDGPCWMSEGAAVNCERACKEDLIRLSRNNWEDLPECRHSFGIPLQLGDYQATAVAIAQDTCYGLSQMPLDASDYNLREEDDQIQLRNYFLFNEEGDEAFILTHQGDTLSGEQQVAIYMGGFEPCVFQLAVAGQITSPTTMDLLFTGNSANCQCGFQFTLALERD